MSKTEVHLERGYCSLPKGGGDDGRSRISPHPKKASLLEWLSVSKFPYRHPVLYGLLFELRSFLHRIQLVRKRGGTRSLEIGLTYQQQDAQSGLVPNSQTQARTLGIQKLLSAYPWVSGEDCHLFLIGWNAAQEWRESFDIVKSSGDKQDSLVSL